MSAIILKFPRSARFRTKAAQKKLDRTFRQVKRNDPECSDRRAWMVALLVERIESRCQELESARGTERNGEPLVSEDGLGAAPARGVA